MPHNGREGTTPSYAARADGGESSWRFGIGMFVLVLFEELVSVGLDDLVLGIPY